MSLYVFWLRKRTSIKYVCNWWRDVGIIMPIAAYRGEGGRNVTPHV